MVRKAMVREVPSDDQVVAALEALNGEAIDAVALCDKLVELGHPPMQSQLAIQRTIERGRIALGNDWKLKVVHQRVAA